MKTNKTKKITYIAPSLEVVKSEINSLLGASIDSNKDIGYGGKDESGKVEPSSLDIDFE